MYNSENQEKNRKRQARYNSENQEKNRKRQAGYDSENREKIRKRQVDARASLSKNQTALGRLRQFRRLQRKGLSFVCASCKRLWFEGSVTKVNERSSHLLKLLDIDFKKEVEIPLWHL